MRKQKILGSCVIIYGKLLEALKLRGYNGTHNQFRVVCRCTGLKDANEKLLSVGIGARTPFRKDYTGETGNKTELEYANKSEIGIAVCVNGVNGNKYATIEELREINEIEKELKDIVKR